jgi:hypothetical protein
MTTAPPADLAEFRLARALRTGGPGAFVQLWNGQAGATWSVFSACCAHEAEALGWMHSFRLDLGERVAQFQADQPLRPQVGKALLEHVADAFDDGASLPEGPLSPDEAGVRRLPRATRLQYLVDLFFDHTAAGDPLREAYRLLEPAADTDARLVVHEALMKNPPAAALVLPPGALERPGPGPTGHRRALVVIVGVAAAAISLLPLARDLFGPSDDPARLYATTMGASGEFLVDGDPVGLQARLARAGLPALLLEVPDLSAADLVLVGARLLPGRVVLLYRGDGVDWTLAHYEGAAPRRGDLVVADGPFEVRRAGEVSAVRWDGVGTGWVLVGPVEPGAALDVARRVGHPG